MDIPSVAAGDIGPLTNCRLCGRHVATYFDIKGGQWELLGLHCGHVVKRLTTIAPLADEAYDTRPQAHRKPPQHKERV